MNSNNALMAISASKLGGSLLLLRPRMADPARMLIRR